MHLVYPYHVFDMDKIMPELQGHNRTMLRMLSLADRDGSGLHRARDKSTIKRLQMYTKGGKAIRFVKSQSTFLI